MRLTSPIFTEGGKIPSKYTCDAENVSPPLEIHDIPAGTRSLALIMDDPDIPAFVKEKYGIELFVHWVVFNMPANEMKILEGKTPRGVLGSHGAGKHGYTGPCPPDREHRYFFKLYALDGLLDLPAGATKENVEAAMHGHVLAHAQLMGKYERMKK